MSEEHLKATKQQFEQCQKRDERDRRIQCHQTLKTSSYEEHKDFNPPKVPGTCAWALRHERFRYWNASSKDDLLWISADPGCGKSVLAKSLIDVDLQRTDARTTSYFFFKDNGQQESIATAFCAILHQLFSRRLKLIEYAMSAFDRLGKQITLDFPELWRILLAATADPEAGEVICILDALDECKETERQRLMAHLTGFYNETKRYSTSNRRGRLKFLVTSRPYDDIRRGFNAFPDELPLIHLRGEDENDSISKEIDLVIKKRVEDLTVNLNLDKDTRLSIQRKLLSVKHRTYLWLHLAIQDIDQTYQDCLRFDQDSINLIPATVEQAYEKILNRPITKRNKNKVRKVFQIILGARRPLAIKEMAIALGIATSEGVESLEKACLPYLGLGDKLRRMCGLFVFINHYQFYLIHQTAKEFLVRQGDLLATTTSSWKYCLSWREVEALMTEICAKFLCLKDVELAAEATAQDSDSDSAPVYSIADAEYTNDYSEVENFLAYSSLYWPMHFKDSHLSIEDPVMQLVWELYDTTRRIHILWTSISDALSEETWDMPGMAKIQLAATLGHNTILEVLLEQTRSDDGIADYERETALAIASSLGNEQVVQQLIDAGVRIENDDKGVGPLELASSKGNLEIVRILLRTLANSGNETLGSAASNAVQLPSSAGDSLDNALYEAAFHGREQVVRILLDAGANADAQDISANTALMAASSNDHEEVVQMLLDAGANINTCLGSGTALHRASQGSLERVVEVLLKGGADIDAQGGEYILDRAGERSSERRGRSKQRLFPRVTYHGEQLEFEKSYQATALQLACEAGHEPIVNALLKAKANVNAGAEIPRTVTALQWASRRGYATIVRRLLHAGADVNARGIDGTALQLASWKGYEVVVRILLDANADVAAGAMSPYGTITGNEEDVKWPSMINCWEPGYRQAAGVTPLQLAVIFGKEAVARLLLDAGADIDAHGIGCPRSPLWLALPRENMARMLLERGANVDAENKYAQHTPLQKASEAGHDFWVNCLLEYGANVNARGSDECMAIHRASRKGHVTVVQILLDAGADVNARAGDHGTALQQAAGEGHKQVVKVLLDAGADIKNEAGCPGKGTSLQRASQNGHQAVVRMLLDRGAGIEARSQECHRTSLQLASWEGHQSVARLLLEKGANIVGETGISALELAMYRGHKSVFMALLDAGANLDNADLRDPSTWLQQAAADGNFSWTKTLLKTGSDVNGMRRRGPYCRTALQEASEGGHHDIVLELLIAGAQVNAVPVGFDPSSPIQLAAREGHEAVVDKLLSWGATVDEGAEYGGERTALQWASWKGQEEMVLMLLDAGANVDAEGTGVFGLGDGGNGNALWLASRAGHEGTVKVLREAGATEGRPRHLRRWTFGGFRSNSDSLCELPCCDSFSYFE